MATILINTHTPFHSKGEGKKILLEKKRDFIRKKYVSLNSTRKNFTNKKRNKNGKEQSKIKDSIL
jgi:hypothetical protein